MKFVHFGDCHLDAPFVELGETESKANIKRHEVLDTFSRVIDYVRTNGIDAIFLSGDLFEQNYVEKSTIKFIDDKFRSIPNVHIFISPGNHDPLIQNSYYNTYVWSSNVHIFGPDFQNFRLDELDLNVWGLGFDSFYLNRCKVREVPMEYESKINVLVVHATLDGEENGEYHSVSSKFLESCVFDYCALGHIHKHYGIEKSSIYYSGSPEPLGFDEPGIHGFVAGEITKDYKHIEFVPIAKRKYIVQEVNIEGAESTEEITDKIKLAVSLESAKDNYYNIRLIGMIDDNIYIDTQVIKESLKNYFYFLKLEDNTEPSYPIKDYENEYNLRGVFVKEMSKLIEKAPSEDKEKLKKALVYGLDALTKGNIKLRD